jgi:hypothetical protein
MTMAVCFKCGEIKFGAFCPCSKCASAPRSEDDLALSLAMTDHYFDMPALEQMGKRIKSGEGVSLHPETYQQLIALIRSGGIMEKLEEVVGEMDSSGAEPEAPSPSTEPPERPEPPEAAPPSPPPKKHWWQFWK